MKTAILEKLGMTGIAGLGLLLLCFFFAVGSVLPMRAELASLDSEKTQLVATLAARRVEAASSPESAMEKSLPPFVEAPELLKQLNVLAEKHGIVIERASYRLKGKEGPRRLEVSMPLKMSYPSLRAYLRDALALTANASLDELSLQRPQASDMAVEAQLRLSYGFAAAP